jgi:hypothetical protein
MSAGLLDMYQGDYLRKIITQTSHMQERDLVGNMMATLQHSIAQLLAEMGPAKDADGSLRTLVVLVANDGVLVNQ